MPIEFHQASDRVTDHDAVREISANYPTAFPQAQNLLVAVEKYNKGDSLFSSGRSKLQKAQNGIYQLERCLVADGQYRSDLSSAENLFQFLTAFAVAFPNWQPEYETLNKLIPLCVDRL